MGTYGACPIKHLRRKRRTQFYCSLRFLEVDRPRTSVIDIRMIMAALGLSQIRLFGYLLFKTKANECSDFATKEKAVGTLHWLLLV